MLPFFLNDRSNNIISLNLALKHGLGDMLLRQYACLLKSQDWQVLPIKRPPLKTLI